MLTEIPPSSEFCVKLALFLFVSHKLGARCKLCNKMQRIAQETTKCLSCIYAIAIGGNKEILKEVLLPIIEKKSHHQLIWNVRKKLECQCLGLEWRILWEKIVMSNT